MKTLLKYFMIVTAILLPIVSLAEKRMLLKLLVVVEMLIIESILLFDEIKKEIVKNLNILFSNNGKVLSSNKSIKSSNTKPPPIGYIIIFSNSIFLNFE
ncbi:MAG: hypothetical protein WC472_01770 [Candidatus Paceibacterota bacterium]